MHHQLQVWADPAEAALRAADYVADRASEAVADHGAFTLAVSGGSTPHGMFVALSRLDVPWSKTQIFQVDERVAPSDDAERNLHQLQQALGGVPASIETMPVELPDLEAAADEYAARLPVHLDLVHLGLGPDGHTASLVPGDAVLAERHRDVAVTAEPYQGRRRMTLTYSGLARARQILWLVTGADKREALTRLLDGDAEIPAGRVTADASLVMADRAAAPEQGAAA